MPSMDLAGDMCYLSECPREICRVNYHLDFPEEKNKLRDLTHQRAEQAPESRTLRYRTLPVLGH